MFRSLKIAKQLASNYQINKTLIASSQTKVVDRSGKPLVMFQGRSKKGLTSLFHNGEGWFSRHRGVGVQFADMYKHLELYDTPEKYDTIKNEELRGEVYAATLDIKDPAYVDVKETNWNRNKEREFIKRAKAQGKDGLILTQNDDIRDAVVFNQNQINIINSESKEVTASSNEFEVNDSYLKEPAIGYKNPTPKQINEVKRYDQVRAFLVGKDMYVWPDALHATAARSLGISGDSNIIPLNMFLEGSKIGAVSITDFANHTKWHHNPKLKDTITKNKWIKLYANNEDLKDPDFVSYYDQAIYGPWHEMKIASSNDLENKVKSILPKLTKKAQEEYDRWDEENIDEYAGGGICHILADEFVDVLSQNNIDSSSLSHPFKQHVYIVVFDTDNKIAITVDLPEYVYETGGGFSWKKIEDVEIEPSDFIIEEINWDDLFDENDELIDY